MLSKFIETGIRIEMQALDKVFSEKYCGDAQKIYYSKVYEILSEDTLEIAMPREKDKLILLPVDSEYDLVFYGKTGVYQCQARVIDRYKSNNQYILVVELISNLRKHQRREYYRFNCALEMRARVLSEEEVQEIDNLSAYKPQPGLPLKSSVIVDISGGGLRFLSEQCYEPESFLYCSYHLLQGNIRKKYEMIGKVLTVKKAENRPRVYEHRVQYYNIDNDTREEIIKYIFEEERKSRKKGKGL